MRSKLTLLVGFLLSAVTGVLCHVTEDTYAVDHHVWMKFQILHILASVGFVVLVWFHIKPAWRWYVKWTGRNWRHKSLVTLSLSLAMVFLIISGLILIPVSGGGSALGLWHYRIGLLFIVLCVWHAASRIHRKRHGKRAAGTKKP